MSRCACRNISSRRAIVEIEAIGDAQSNEGGDRLALLIRSVEEFESQRPPAAPLQAASIDDFAQDCGEELLLADPRATTFWMNRRVFRSEFTPLQLAEQDDADLQMILDDIGRIEAGVFY